jgi:hypothetical protein
MKLKLFGALIGTALMALVGSANATPFDGTTLLTTIATPIPSDGNAHTISPSSASNGINGASFTTGQRYFDYIVEFTLAGPSDVNISSSVVGKTPNRIDDYHTALFSTQPLETGMFFDSNSGHTINLLGTLTPAAPLGDTTLLATNLAGGSYFLHLFGVLKGDGNNSFVDAITASITATPVAATPLPAGLVLFVTGLGGLGFAAWRRKAAPTAAV